MHVITAKALKILNFSGYPLTCVSSSLQQKHSKMSTFGDAVSLGYPSRYTKSTGKCQLFRIPSHLCIHPVAGKALKNLNFSGYPLTRVSIPLHQKHSKISTFQDTLSFGCHSRFTKGAQKSHLFGVSSQLRIHLVTRKAVKNFNFSVYPLAFVSISSHPKHSKISAFQDILSLGYPCRHTKRTQKSQVFRIPSRLSFRYLNVGYYDTSLGMVYFGWNSSRDNHFTIRLVRPRNNLAKIH